MTPTDATGNRCEALVWDDWQARVSHRCTRAAKRVRTRHGNDHWLCRQHFVHYDKNPTGSAFVWEWET